MDASVWLLASMVAIWMHKLDLKGLLATVALQRSQSIAVSLGDGVICVDAKGRISFWNPAAEAIFLRTSRHALGTDFYALIKGGKPALDAVRLAHGRAASAMELVGLRADGEEFPLELSVSGPEKDERAGFCAIARDIGARKRSEARIRHLALHDGLTGLANRSSLRDHIRGRIDAAGTTAPFAVLHIDLDGFKAVNDKLGHDGGDRVLKLFADSLRESLHPDDFIARLGGDEFAVVCDLRSARLECAARAISQIFGDDDRHTVIEGQGFVLSASMGSASYPADGLDVDDLLERSDLALYRAKRSGRARHVVYDRRFKDAVDRRQDLMDELRRAFREDRFELFYQPQLHLADRRIVGVEALMRWRHPERGVVLPAEFLSALGDSAIAADVGDWTLRTACRQAAAWRTAGYETCVGINLFPAQLEPKLPAHIARVLAETNLPPHLLEIDVTEGMLLRDQHRVIEILRDIHRLGVRVALDDFGAGLASLVHLKRLPLHRLKIDRTFVAAFGTDRAKSAIVTAIVALARELGIVTLAEGIEDAACARLLEIAGCVEGQGHLFGRPVPGEECRPLLPRLRHAGGSAA